MFADQIGLLFIQPRRPLSALRLNGNATLLQQPLASCRRLAAHATHQAAKGSVALTRPMILSGGWRRTAASFGSVSWMVLLLLFFFQGTAVRAAVQSAALPVATRCMRCWSSWGDVEDGSGMPTAGIATASILGSDLMASTNAMRAAGEPQT